MKLEPALPSRDLTDGRLKVVVFTSGPLIPVNSVFLERLSKDPLLDLRGIIIDEYRRPRKNLAQRVLKSLREERLPWLAFKLRSRLEALVERLALWFFEALHPRVSPQESYEAFETSTGVPVYRVADIHSEQSLKLIRSLAPQLGVILGGRILRDTVISIPEYGTLNIHKRKVPEYRGGGPVGYWELLAGESSIGVTIHYAIPRVDAGPVLAQATIPIEECDTLESLQIKADILGAQLYHDAIRRAASGLRQGAPQDTSRGKTFRAPSEFKIWRLQRALKKKAAERWPSQQSRPSVVVQIRMLVQYALILPLLLYYRNRFTKQRQAPISMFFYHVVSNSPLNHLCMPLEGFVTQVEFLRRYYKVLSLPEAVERIRSGRNDEIAVSLTFDDGYKDNTWAIEYLKYYGVPASFFVSIGHVLDRRAFEHDRRLGFENAVPMTAEDVRSLVSGGFVVGSHGIYHEDLGGLDPAATDRVLRESRELIEQVCGQAPEHFSFPKGQRKAQITPKSFPLAKKHYRYVYSAYGGYNFPCKGKSHFLRMPSPSDVLELAMAMDGYCGFRQSVAGNAWGLAIDRLPPY